MSEGQSSTSTISTTSATAENASTPVRTITMIHQDADLSQTSVDKILLGKDAPQDPLYGYKIIRDLRSGGEGKAILMEKNGVKYVCKQRIFDSIIEANVGLREAYSMAGIKDENIVKFEEVFLRTEAGSNQIQLMILMQYCEKGDLLDFLHELVSLNDNNSATATTDTTISTDFTYSVTTDFNRSSFESSGNLSHVSIRSHQSLSDGHNNQHFDKMSYLSVSDFKPKSVTAPSSTPPPNVPEVITEERKCIMAHAKELVKKIIDKEALYLSIHVNHHSTSSSSSAKSPSKSAPVSTTSLPSSPSNHSLDSASDNYIRGQVLIQRDILQDWLVQLCLGVHALHKERMIHRDLKCENIFIASDDRLMIGDFGLAVKSNNGHGRVGTYIYSAPEVLSGQPYDRSADIFSLGCIFYELITLKLLARHRRYFAEEINANRFDKMSFLSDFPEKFTRLGPIVLKMLDKTPSMRPSIESIISLIKGDNDIGSDLRLRLKKNDGQRYPGVRRQLSKTDHREFAEVFARAFKYDPRYTALFPPDEPNSPKLLLELFIFTAHCFYKQSCSFWGYFGKDGKMKAACVWFNPDKKKQIKFGDIFVGGMKFVSKAGLLRSRKGMKMMNAIANIVTSHDDERHWALAYIGTDDDCRNTGIGTYLVEPVLEWADHSQTKCMTFSFEKKSLPFLQRLGFELKKEIVGYSGLPKAIDAARVFERQPVKKND
eukprot:gene13060-15356_t